jgi:DNA-directed RNA polymerases I and III subunit RPAC2
MSVNDHRTEPTTELFSVQNSGNDQNATFIFGNEDHTLGNSLRHLLIQRKETEFCGYSVPHPYEPKMHVRLQTNDIRAIDGLRRGLDDLEEVANLLDDRFLSALQRFKSKNTTTSSTNITSSMGEEQNQSKKKSSKKR